MLSLTYFSTETQPFSDQDLESLLKNCVANNSRLGITGMLLYKNRNFLQAIEGPDQVVEALYSAIKTDSRHSQFVEFSKRPIENREFAKWEMGFKNLNDVVMESIPGFDDMATPFSSQEFRQDIGRAHRLLLYFATH